MKKLIYIFIVLMITSCKNESVNKVSEIPVDYETSEDYEIVEESLIKDELFTDKDLSIEKLKELYDLIALKQKHPEFDESIKAQLKKYTNDTIMTLNEIGGLIKNIKLKGQIIQVSDSVKKMKLYYDIVSNNSIQRDSIWAEITTNEISIEGKKTKSKKIKFSSK